MTNEPMQQTREFTGRHMLAIMLAFFGVIIAVNFTMAWLAGHSWTGLVVKNSYVASQEFNGRLRQAEAQKQRGWQTGFNYASGELRFRLADRDANPLDAGSLTLSIGRPATETSDQTLPLVQTETGLYVAKSKLDPGLWAVVITSAPNAEPFRYERRFMVAPDGKVK